MTFEEWYAQTEWWKDHRDELAVEWALLKAFSVPEKDIAMIFDKLVSAMRDEYGD